MLETECVAFVGLGCRAEPESVHRFGLDAGAGAEDWFAETEAV